MLSKSVKKESLFFLHSMLCYTLRYVEVITSARVKAGANHEMPPFSSALALRLVVREIFPAVGIIILPFVMHAASS